MSSGPIAEGRRPARASPHPTHAAEREKSHEGAGKEFWSWPRKAMDGPRMNCNRSRGNDAVTTRMNCKGAAETTRKLRGLGKGGTANIGERFPHYTCRRTAKGSRKINFRRQEKMAVSMSVKVGALGSRILVGGSNGWVAAGGTGCGVRPAHVVRVSDEQAERGSIGRRGGRTVARCEAMFAP